MPRYLHVVPGVPARNGIDPFTKHPITIPRRAEVIRFWEAQITHGEVELAVGGTRVAPFRWRRSFERPADAQQYVDRLSEARVAEGFHHDGDVQELKGPYERPAAGGGARADLIPSARIDLTAPSEHTNAANLRVLFRMDGADTIQEVSADEDGTGLGKLIRVAAAEAPRSLRKLSIGSPNASQWSPKHLGDCEPLFDLPLRALHLYGSHFHLGYADAPQLEELEVLAISPRRQDIRALLRSNFPALHSLKLFLGPADFDTMSADDHPTVDDLGPLLRGEVLSSVRMLGIQNWERTNELCGALVASPIVSRIEHLDLSGSALDDRGAAALVRAKDALRLTSLNVAECRLTPAGLRELQGLAERFDGHGQRARGEVAILG